MPRKINNYPIEKIRQWIDDGETQSWIGNQLGYDAKLIYKACKKYGIKCQRTGPRSGQGHPEWNGGKIVDKSGYILVYTPDHPGARKPRMKYVPEHRLVMEKQLGRYLTRNEVVHHKNGIKNDNRPENLQIFTRNADHLKHELTGKCPKWTQDGKARLQQSMRQLADNRRGLKPDEYRNKQKIRHSIKLLHTNGLNLF